MCRAVQRKMTAVWGESHCKSEDNEQQERKTWRTLWFFMRWEDGNAQGALLN